jgi:hypothetical protein
MSLTCHPPKRSLDPQGTSACPLPGIPRGLGKERLFLASSLAQGERDPPAGPGCGQILGLTCHPVTLARAPCLPGLGPQL